MKRVFNFSAGPAMVPEPVLRQAQEEMLDWHHSGMSIMELGHRGSEFQGVIAQTEADLREVMKIPKNYQVLFVPGGATTQFSMVPLNLMSEANLNADYIETGVWSRKAVIEAKRYGTINVAARNITHNGIHSLPLQAEWKMNPEASFLHYTPNETVDGLEFHWVPKIGAVPLVADMTSCILAEPIDVNQFSVIYAGSQKNIGQAGITVVIIRQDLVKEALPKTPVLYSYKTLAENNSCYNTPPTYAIYMAGLVLQWIKKEGGLTAIGERNHRKSKKLYDCIDHLNHFYFNQVDPSCRALMNVVFSLKKEELTDDFLQKAEHEGLTNLRGHRVVGGCRASIYNAMPEAGVDLLVEFMKVYAQAHG